MKKLLWVLFFFTLALGGCASESASEGDGEKDSQQEPKSEEKADEKEKENEKEKESQEPGVTVDKKLLHVEITLPATFVDFQETSFDQIKKEAAAEGIADVIQNDDGSITYKMSKKKHEEIMEEFKKEMTVTMNQMKDSGDYPSIQNVEANDAFTEFTMTVDQSAYEDSFDGFASLGIGMTGLIYQLFNGVDPDHYNVTIHVVNAEDGKEFDTILYPEALEQLGEIGE
ncbi:hypothetical protein [Halobacillus litoralis]|uniref:hypothetical protein n=1 Tax=Halobacillus litoralis TaxID=45668 RepID=UPI001CFD6BDA|nr:hypothetical protein [Halobacillus litoralis]